MEMMDDTASCSENTMEENLPFAIEPASAEEYHRPQHEECVKEAPIAHNFTSALAAAGYCQAGYCQAGSVLSSGSHPPQLASSLISNQTDASSTTAGGSSLLHDRAVHDSLMRNYSQYVETAASLVSPDSSSLLARSPDSSSLLARSNVPRHGHTVDSTRQHPAILPSSEPASTATVAAAAAAPDQSIAFSQLLREADQGHSLVDTSGAAQRLPVLPEECSVTNSASSSVSYIHLLADDLSGYGGVQQNRFGAGESMQQQQTGVDGNIRLPANGGGGGSSVFGRQTIIPPATEASMNLSQRRNLAQERRMAALAGASAQITGEASFRVSVDLQSSQTCSVRDVMDVVGNPDMLGFWCDPVKTLVVTSSSEGARDAINRQAPSSDQQRGRQYEGEWIEATTAQLVLPNNTSCFYSTSRALSVVMGFPTYGKITMFVERQRGQVGLTIGPFPGSIEVSHRIGIEQVLVGESGGKIRVTDDVRLQKDYGEDAAFCGMAEVAEQFFLPGLGDYMDQVLSSMARLRFLVENGESGPTPTVMGATTLSEGETKETPLLG